MDFLRSCLVVSVFLLVSANFLAAQTPPTPGVIQFAKDSYEFTEASQLGVIGLDWKRNSAPSIPSFRIAVTGGTAVRHEDFKIQDGELNFWHSFPVEIIDDGVHEPDETIELTLTDPGPGLEIGPRAKALVTLRNSPPTIGLRSDSRIHEQFGGSIYRVVVERHGDRELPASVSLSVKESLGGLAVFDVAKGGKDFLPFDQRLEFASGEKVRSVDVTILDDAEVEDWKTFQVELSQPIGGILRENEAILTAVIEDNEAATHLDVTQQFPVVDYPFGRQQVLFSRPKLTRLNFEDSLGERFVPQISPPYYWYTPLQSGALLAASPEHQAVVRLREDVTLDPAFRIDVQVIDSMWTLGIGRFDHPQAIPITEAADGTLWWAGHDAASGAGVLLHLHEDGVLLKATTWTLPPLNVENPDFHRRLMGALPDGRLIFEFPNGIQIFRYGEKLERDASFPTLRFGTFFTSNAAFDFVAGRPNLLLGGNGWVNGVPTGLDNRSHVIRLTNLPETSLQLSAHNFPASGATDSYYGSEMAEPFSYIWEPEVPWRAGTNFLVRFHRLGPSTRPAIVHFTTRDITATAGKDYVARSGTLNFAPLEVEKLITIPILPDREVEFDESLEVVVTGGDGFVEWPAPLRLTIQEEGPAPRLERVHRLRDGRVLLGGTASRPVLVNGALWRDSMVIEFSNDLKSWKPLADLRPSVPLSDDTAGWLDASATNAPTRFYRAVAR